LEVEERGWMGGGGEGMTFEPVEFLPVLHVVV
jgi:hypothetical protein